MASAREVEVAALMALALVGGSLLVPSASVAAAGRPQAVRVTRAASAAVVLGGDTVTVRGRVRPAPRGSSVKVQRRSGNRWRTVVRTRTGSSGRYAVTWKPARTRSYRVYSPADRRRRPASSKAFRVAVRSCTRLNRPSGDVAAWFSAPYPGKTSNIATKIRRLVCAAAPRSKINIAMYFIRGGTQSRAILSALENVARYRDVAVTVLLEGKLYAKTSPLYPSMRQLQRYATVLTCRLGCHDRRTAEAGTPSLSIMHHKFLTISDMLWRSYRDPAVLFSSANWSRVQLARRWQSSVMAYNDVKLFDEVDAQWSTLVACASRGGCVSWGRRVSSLGLPVSDQGMTDRGGLWVGNRARHTGDPGRGTSVSFTPVASGDPLAAALNDYACTAKNRTVRVAHMFVTPARRRVVNALARLAAAGCDVKVVVSQPSVAAQRAGISMMRAAGLKVSCVRGVHDKFVLVDGYRWTDARPDQSLWMGSQSLGGNALRRNDESMFRLSTGWTGGSSVAANRAVFDAYARQWALINRWQRPCRTAPDAELSALANSLTADPDDTVMPQ